MKFTKFCSHEGRIDNKRIGPEVRASQKCRATNAALSSVVAIPIKISFLDDGLGDLKPRDSALSIHGIGVEEGRLRGGSLRDTPVVEEVKVGEGRGA